MNMYIIEEIKQQKLILVKSCFEPFDDKVFSCSCGWPECADIYNLSSCLTETGIFLHVNDDYFKFDKKQYIVGILPKPLNFKSVDQTSGVSPYF